MMKVQQSYIWYPNSNNQTTISESCPVGATRSKSTGLGRCFVGLVKCDRKWRKCKNLCIVLTTLQSTPLPHSSFLTSALCICSCCVLILEIPQGFDSDQWDLIPSQSTPENASPAATPQSPSRLQIPLPIRHEDFERRDISMVKAKSYA